MCSATHKGFRVRRSNADVVEGVGRKSDTGPGKPYWKRPEGSTGLRRVGDGGEGIGVGYGGVVDVGELLTADGTTCAILRSLVEKMAAVAAAPVKAETPAIMAIVVFDIIEREIRDCEGRADVSFKIDAQRRSSAGQMSLFMTCGA